MSNGALYFNVNLSDIYECDYPRLSVTRNFDAGDRLVYHIEVRNTHPFSVTMK